MPDNPDTLPPKPQPPQNYDCCGGGCADCDLRIYQRELLRWKKMEAVLLAGDGAPQAPR
ncbi:MAG: oxidoreductase-like domain-containing protein [Nevskiales bacterium]